MGGNMKVLTLLLTVFLFVSCNGLEDVAGESEVKTAKSTNTLNFCIPQWVYIMEVDRGTLQ